MSNIARVYPSGQELAIPTILAKTAVNGSELAHNGNATSAHDYKDDRTK